MTHPTLRKFLSKVYWVAPLTTMKIMKQIWPKLRISKIEKCCNKQKSKTMKLTSSQKKINSKNSKSNSFQNCLNSVWKCYKITNLWKTCRVRKKRMNNKVVKRSKLKNKLNKRFKWKRIMLMSHLSRGERRAKSKWWMKRNLASQYRVKNPFPMPVRKRLQQISQAINMANPKSQYLRLKPFHSQNKMNSFNSNK